ncbi:MAG: type IX secretion system membrane protein PorP/SprF [Bacteroidetes bacterium]|nr:type IX secretion system membrane protein PorP/SprF [Bacteroidota bacterium]
MKTATPFRVPRHYFAYAKYSWDINEKFNLTPAVFVRSIDFIAQAEVNLSLTYNKRVVVGVLYRSVDDAGLMLGVHITKHLWPAMHLISILGNCGKYQTGSLKPTHLPVRWSKTKRFLKSPIFELITGSITTPESKHALPGPKFR